MNRWTLPVVSGVLLTAALLHLSAEPPPPFWSAAPGDIRTVVRTSLEGAATRDGAAIVRAQGLRLRLEGKRATLESVGPQSDALLAAFDHVCAGDYGARGMRPSSEFGFRVVSGDLEQLGARPVTLQLAFESEPEERYAELFLDVNPGEKAVSLQEREDRYCTAVVRYLESPAP